MKIAVWCNTHGLILDEGEVDDSSSLLVWNDFTQAKKHLKCEVIIRTKANCAITLGESRP